LRFQLTHAKSEKERKKKILKQLIRVYSFMVNMEGREGQSSQEKFNFNLLVHQSIALDKRR